ncbi:ABC transporter ATP-binding protein [Luminiphilus sp.]|nr:ABC transporter ATP-binding protein [Luminiphilus sp.]MDC3405136.1 ABC transporter ATP-binding protein [Luminiphilus sp.]
MAQITLSDLAHSYVHNGAETGDFALKTLNHVWQDGGAYALLGPSGCGKTTLLNIISGLITPSRGRVLFDGVDMTESPAETRNIAQVFQFPVVYDTMTVRENLAFPLKNRGLARAAIQARVALIAEMMGLGEILDRKARGLPADAKQKISLARGMVRESVNAILFDEPLTVIDPQLKWELRTQLKSLHRELRHTMIYVTHDQVEALTFADTVVMMHEGRVLQTGTPESLFETPAHTFVGHFIGSPGMNFLEAKIEGSRGVINGQCFPLGASYRTASGFTQIGIRPEYIQFSADEGLPVVVKHVEDVGRRRIVHAELANSPISVSVPEGQFFDNTMARVRFIPDKINIFVDDWRVQGEAL